MEGRPVILTVGSNRRNLELLSEFLSKQGYDTRVANTLEEFDQAMANNHGPIRLALVDIGGFDREVWSRCETLRSKSIPLLVISPKQSEAVSQQSMASGAHGVLVKPLVVKELIGLIRNLMV